VVRQARPGLEEMHTKEMKSDRELGVADRVGKIKVTNFKGYHTSW